MKKDEMIKRARLVKLDLNQKIQLYFVDGRPEKTTVLSGTVKEIVSRNWGGNIRIVCSNVFENDDSDWKEAKEKTATFVVLPEDRVFLFGRNFIIMNKALGHMTTMHAEYLPKLSKL